MRWGTARELADRFKRLGQLRQRKDQLSHAARARVRVCSRQLSALRDAGRIRISSFISSVINGFIMGSMRHLIASSMRDAARRRASRLVLVSICAVIVAGVLPAASSGPQVIRLRPQTHAAPAVIIPPDHSEAIIRENALSGTTDWIVSPSRTATNEIQAYAGATAVSPGDTLSFYVSVEQGGDPYQIDVYRLGWYGGAGGRLVWQAQRAGQAQGYWDETKGVLVSCGTCKVDRKTGLAEANWQPSYQLKIPSTWLTGVYLAKFTEQQGGKATTVTFDVRGDPHSTYVVMTTDTTVQAYSDWGGASLYLARYKLANLRGSSVSFDRPVAGWGTAQGLLYEIDGVRWLEKNGYDVSYASDVDVHEHPEQLLGHRAFLDFGHDEYWSKEIRDGIEHARDAGVGLGFIGANTGYWQIRFQPDSQGIADRTIVCYKSAAGDPYLKGDRSRLTVEWRSGWLARPENALLGEMYSDWISPPRAYPWRVSPVPGTASSSLLSSSLLAGTGLRAGQSYGCDLVGYEWDKVYNNGHSPSGMQVLSSSPVTSIYGKRDTSNTVYYIAPSGALVFDAGSVKWDYALDSFRLVPDHGCGAQQNPVPGMQQLLANVLAALAERQKP